MEYGLPEDLQSRRTELLNQAKAILPSHDGCEDARYVSS